MLKSTMLAGAAAGIVACERGAQDPTVVTSDSAGITIVRNSGPARDTVRLTTPVVRIGHDETNKESVFREVHHVAFTARGNIAVVDGGVRVVIIDSTGGASRTLGAQGRGPGEYLAVRWVLPRGDTIAVWDVRQRRMILYREGGEPLGSIAMTDNTEGRTLLPVPGGWLDEGEMGQHMDTTPARGFILRRGADGVIRDTIVRPYPVPEIGWKIDDPKTGNGSMVNPPALGIAPAWTADAERIVWVSATRPRVHVHSANGELERIIELPRRTGPPTEQERDAFIATLADRYGMSSESAARARATTTFTDSAPAITRVVLDDRGNIWAAGFAATEPFSFVAPTWDVLDGDGRIVRRVEFPERFTLHEVRGGRALGVRTLESGVSTVEVYRIP